MAFRNLKPWRRSEYADFTSLPIKAVQTPDLILDNAIEDHSDENIREGSILDVPTGTLLRIIAGEFDPQGRTNAMFDSSSARVEHLNPQVFMSMNQKRTWRGQGSKAPSSKGGLCPKCGDPMDSNQMEIIEDPESPTSYNYRHKQFAHGGCVRNEDVTSQGRARRRPLKGNRRS